MPRERSRSRKGKYWYDPACLSHRVRNGAEQNRGCGALGGARGETGVSESCGVFCVERRISSEYLMHSNVHMANSTGLYT